VSRHIILKMSLPTPQNIFDGIQNAFAPLNFKGTVGGDVLGHQKDIRVIKVGSEYAASISSVVKHIRSLTKQGALVVKNKAGMIFGNISGSSSIFRDPVQGDVVGHMHKLRVKNVGGVSSEMVGGIISHIYQNLGGAAGNQGGAKVDCAGPSGNIIGGYFVNYPTGSMQVSNPNTNPSLPATISGFDSTSTNNLTTGTFQIESIQLQNSTALAAGSELVTVMFHSPVIASGANIILAAQNSVAFANPIYARPILSSVHNSQSICSQCSNSFRQGQLSPCDIPKVMGFAIITANSITASIVTLGATWNYHIDYVQRTPQNQSTLEHLGTCTAPSQFSSGTCTPIPKPIISPIPKPIVSPIPVQSPPPGAKAPLGAGPIVEQGRTYSQATCST
jgi:hypothetical protein